MARAVRRRKDPREAVLALAPLAVETHQAQQALAEVNGR